MAGFTDGKLVENYILGGDSCRIPGIRRAARRHHGPGVTLKNELSAGLRLYGIDENRVSGLGGNRIKLPAGSHTLNLRHAYDYERSSSGPWVVQYDFTCEFPDSGNYTLHSKDGSIASKAPTIWIEAEGENAPACKRVGA